MPTASIRDIRGQWPYPDVGNARKAGNPCWFETDKGTYWELLECVPPVWAPSGFMVGECAAHTSSGMPIRSYFVETGGRYFVRDVEEAKHPEALAELRAALA